MLSNLENSILKELDKQNFKADIISIVMSKLDNEDKKNDLIRVNIRSRGPIINEVVAKYGGGGHKFASGARLTNWEDAHMLIDDLDKTTLNYKKKTINDMNPVYWTK